jgi:tetratricopeptide (TPR) repeat protein
MKSMSRCHALVIGNSKYINSDSFEQLKYAENDADEVFHLLTDSPASIFDKDTSACHKNLSWQSVPHLLSEFFKPVKPSDLVLIYFAGHGELLGKNRLSLIMKDTEKNNLAGTAFNTERFVDYFEDKKLYRYIVILDCCRAGKALKSPGIMNRGDVVAIDLQHLSDKGKIFVASSGEHQLAKEVDTLQHGLFSYYFIQGIKTGDAGKSSRTLIDIFEICDYIKEQIAKNHPDIYQEVIVSGGDVSGNLSIAKNPKYRKIDIASLPPTSADLFGRNRELELLDSFWNNPKTNIAVFVAWGGVGKTSLVNKWLSLMARDNFQGADRVFGWSFYSQGVGEGKQSSAEPFIDHALRWFGDPNPNEGDFTARGKRLAELISRQKILLILDGLEPLQHPPGHEEGRLKDLGLRVLLRNLAVQNSGLCIITTRLWVDDLKSSIGTSVEKVELSHLAPEDGASLLKHFGVEGTEKELKNASVEFDGHALALTLLGTYLSTVCGGDVRQKDKIECLMIEEDMHGSHARRMMESYEKWMQASDKGRRELNILRIMGLFDRPAESGAIRALRAEPAIPGLTDELQNVSDIQWQFAVKQLRDLRLLSEKDKDRPDSLDCHPLIREHFGEKLKNQNPAAWKEAHSRLYDYYRNLPEKEFPDTLVEMEPLFAAVAHGCKAGRHQEVLDDVYFERILRKSEHYSWKIIGSSGSDLAAISNFFTLMWISVVDNISENGKAFMLHQAGLYLRTLGRLHEASQTMHAGMNERIQQQNWTEAAKGADNLSELWLTIGDIPKAVFYARQSMEYVDKKGEWNWKRLMLTTLADALFQNGIVTEAYLLFVEAEEIQKNVQPHYQYIYGIEGFRYCDFLLSQGKYQDVVERAKETIKIAKRKNWLLDIALDNLSIGKAYLLQTLEQRTHDFTQAKVSLNQAVEGLVKYGSQQHLPLSFLARAALYRLKHEFPKAHADLDEVFEIAERSEMKLYLTDYHLESCRLCIAEGKSGQADQHLESAKKLITETGYHRRDKEAEELERGLNQDSQD